jgi:hypothetical protein
MAQLNSQTLLIVLGIVLFGAAQGNCGASSEQYCSPTDPASELTACLRFRV